MEARTLIEKLAQVIRDNDGSMVRAEVHRLYKGETMKYDETCVMLRFSFKETPEPKCRLTSECFRHRDEVRKDEAE